MERYLLFMGTPYYPGGGWTDLLLKTNDLQEARQMAQDNPKEYFKAWWHIVDTQEGFNIIEKGDLSE